MRKAGILVSIMALAGLCASTLIADPPADYKGKPWKDKAQTIPGKLTLAYYDEGGEGVAYHDTDKVNHGSGELNRGPAEKDNFRKNEGVDVSYTKAAFDKYKDGKKLPLDLYYVGWTAEGEWLNFTVDVEKAGTYTLNILASSKNNTDEQLSLSVNGDKKCTFKLEDTGDYHTWKLQNNVGEITLEKGKQLIKMTIEKQQHATNLLYIEFVPKVAEKKLPAKE